MVLCQIVLVTNTIYHRTQFFSTMIHGDILSWCSFVLEALNGNYDIDFWDSFPAGMDELAKIFRMVVMGEDTVKGIALTMEILRMLRL